ncbi:MAG: hypothetical protein BJ554DRAFT_742, partial [Olpidium bornovanus]
MLSFDIANFPTAETVKMLARLLDQMTKANDRLKASAPSALAASAPTAPQPPPEAPLPPLMQSADHGLSTSTADPAIAGGQASSLWAQPHSVSNSTHPPDQLLQPAHQVTAFTRFHARSIPTIDIYSYLARILKINVLEVEFLRLNNFGISVAVEELQQYGDLLFRHSCTDPIVRQSLIDARLIPPSAASEDFGPPNSLPLYPTSEREQRERGRSGGEAGDT